MKKNLTLFISLIAFSQAMAQPATRIIPGSTPQAPDWGMVTKSAGDSCGAYFNNYIGLKKTTSINAEEMRRGDIVEDYPYAGRAQRFTTSQPVEVSGVEFYAWHESMTQDSIMVITSLHTYNAGLDSLGPELTRDTVYVTHTAYTPVLPNISVKSYFDAPVSMVTTYVIAMHTPENEELWIITNDESINEGDGEFLSYALYDNPAYPADYGWYSNAGDIGPFDYDYLMNPLVKYDLHNSFNLLSDTICPDMINAGCVNYTQMGNYSNHMYNGQSTSPSSHLVWLWGDGFQNTDILMACHTYNNPGTFNINLRDTLFRHSFSSPYCVADISKPVVALDVPVPSFTFLQDGLTADFTNTSTNADSVWWDFGDGSPGTDLDNPSHTYAALGTYTVWIHSYNMCYEDSTALPVTTDDVGIKNNTDELLIYPNPANSQVTLSGLRGEAKIELLNMIGELIYVTGTADTNESINVSQLAPGTYFVRITDENGMVTKKIAVKH